MNELENEEILIGGICKSISGNEDENGNYIFEVEASNENLDLQNQITLQSALLKSKEYFLTNGVISDDHLHKTRNPDGSVETHKDRIIGEPISIRTDGKSTFVKGILYSGVKAAKDYINLLKNKSSRVKASIGGIMPKVHKNADGTETITAFMWNDLALTCSPVNWTVGSAKFAKSMNVVDFCKSLNAGSGTDSASYEDGRALQNEDLENETVKIQELSNDGDLSGDTEKDDFEKSEVDDDAIIRECKICIDSGELKSMNSIQRFLMDKGFDKTKARDKTLEIIKVGGAEMKKSHFSSTISELLKSFSDENDTEAKENKDADNNDSKSLFDEEEKEKDEEENVNSEAATEDNQEDEVEKCGVKKSVNDGFDGDYLDATELIKSMGETIDAQNERIESLEKSLEEIQENMIDVTKSFGNYLKTPNGRATVVEKSLDGTSVSKNSKGPSRRPTTEEFDILKSALVNAAKDGTVDLDKVQYLNSQFQKSMKGEQINPKAWNEICNIVKKYQ